MNILSTLSVKTFLIFNNFLSVAEPPPGVSPGGSIEKPVGVDNAQNFITRSELWQKVIIPISVALAIAVVIFTIFNIVKSVLNGGATDVFKTAVKGLLLAALLFNLNLVFTLITAAGSVLEAFIKALAGLIA
jgi:hypothetical protein